MYNTRFNIQAFTFNPECVSVMYVDLRAVIISLSSIIRLDFVTEKECVYSALRIEYFILFCKWAG